MIMARSRSIKPSDSTFSKDTVIKAQKEENSGPSSEEVTEVPEESKEICKDPKAPVNIELEVSEEPQKPAPAPAAEKIQTSVQERLTKRSSEENIFAPSNPAALEKAAAEIAKEQGFQLNRGTSIGARLIARSLNKS